MSKKVVLLIGSRGHVGSSVVEAVLATDKCTVKALLRPGSNDAKVEAAGVTVVRGDAMDPPSLAAAFQGADVVINTANGHGQGHPEIDAVGANDVVDAAKAGGAKRCVAGGLDRLTVRCRHFAHPDFQWTHTLKFV